MSMPLLDKIFEGAPASVSQPLTGEELKKSGMRSVLRLLNMRPNHTPNDLTDQPNTYIVIGRYGFVCLAVRSADSNGANIRIVQFCAPCLHPSLSRLWVSSGAVIFTARAKAEPHRVIDVLSPSAVFKVGGAVVGLISVLVVNFSTNKRPRTQEGQSDETVNVKPGCFPWLSPNVQSDSGITALPTISPNCKSENFLGAVCPIENKVSFPSHSAQTGDRIKSGNTEWGSTPFFRRQLFCGKLLLSHCRNLLDRFGMWSGSFAVQPAFGPFLF
jgi:hypothetical protein